MERHREGLKIPINTSDHSLEEDGELIFPSHKTPSIGGKFMVQFSFNLLEWGESKVDMMKRRDQCTNHSIEFIKTNPSLSSFFFIVVVLLQSQRSHWMATDKLIVVIPTDWVEVMWLFWDPLPSFIIPVFDCFAPMTRSQTIQLIVLLESQFNQRRPKYLVNLNSSGSLGRIR